MLKHRIIPTLLYDGFQCVKPVSFGRPYRKLGPMSQYINVMERRDVDELIIIDIEATPNKREPLYDKIRSFADNLYCPLTVGGGISSLDHISKLLENGADKVAIKTRIDLMYEASRKFGSQAIVAVMDMNDSKSATYNDFLESEIEVWSQYYQNNGAGEILLTNELLDGTMQGYSLSDIKEVVKAVSIPVIASGGCGEPAHMHAALLAGASAVAAGSIFLYTDHTPRSCAKYLAEHNMLVRV